MLTALFFTHCGRPYTDRLYSFDQIDNPILSNFIHSHDTRSTKYLLFFIQQRSWSIAWLCCGTSSSSILCAVAESASNSSSSSSSSSGGGGGGGDDSGNGSGDGGTCLCLLLLDFRCGDLRQFSFTHSDSIRLLWPSFSFWLESLTLPRCWIVGLWNSFWCVRTCVLRASVHTFVLSSYGLPLYADCGSQCSALVSVLNIIFSLSRLRRFRGKIMHNTMSSSSSSMANTNGFNQQTNERKEKWNCDSFILLYLFIYSFRYQYASFRGFIFILAKFALNMHEYRAESLSHSQPVSHWWWSNQNITNRSNTRTNETQCKTRNHATNCSAYRQFCLFVARI